MVRSLFSLVLCLLSFLLSCACSLPACPEESASLIGVRRMWPESCSHYLTLPPSRFSLFLDFSFPQPFPPYCSCQQIYQLSTTNYGYTHTHTHAEFTNRPAWHTEKKIERHQKVLQIVLGDIHLVSRQINHRLICGSQPKCQTASTQTDFPSWQINALL